MEVVRDRFGGYCIWNRKSSFSRWRTRSVLFEVHFVVRFGHFLNKCISISIHPFSHPYSSHIDIHPSIHPSISLLIEFSYIITLHQDQNTVPSYHWLLITHKIIGGRDLTNPCGFYYLHLVVGLPWKPSGIRTQTNVTTFSGYCILLRLPSQYRRKTCAKLRLPSQYWRWTFAIYVFTGHWTQWID